MTTAPSGLGQWSSVSSSAARIPLATPAPEGAGGAELPPFEAIYESHFDFVWRSARRLGLPEAAAEDCVQDVFVVLHRKLAEYDGRTPLRRWVLGITVRVAADHRRRWRRKESACVPHESDSSSDLALASLAPPPNEQLEKAEALAVLERLLGELEEPKREVLVLAELEEMTAPEIGELLGVNVNTVYARLRAARKDFETAYARHRARTAHSEWSGR